MRVELAVLDNVAYLTFVNGIEIKMDKIDYDRVLQEKCRFICMIPKNQNQIIIRVSYWIDGKYIRESLGRWILKLDKSKVVTYKNLNERDLTRENLVVVDSSHRSSNRRGAQKNSKSGIRGVVWDEQYEKWRAYVKRDKRNVTIDHYDDINEATNAVKEYRKQNMPYSFADK